MPKNESTTDDVTFGTNTTDTYETYRQASRQAHTNYRAVVDKVNDDLYAACKAVRKVLPNEGATRGHADAVSELLSTLSAPQRQKDINAARDVMEQAIKTAGEERDKGLNADPFTKFVRTYIAEEHGVDYADTLSANMPLTYPRMRELANAEEWCGDYEYAMRQAWEQGALPRMTQTVRRLVPSSHVPESYGAKAGEQWEESFRIPAYHRTMTPRGEQVGTGTLRRIRLGDSIFTRIDNDSDNED